MLHAFLKYRVSKVHSDRNRGDVNRLMTSIITVECRHALYLKEKYNVCLSVSIATQIDRLQKRIK